jgi:hypothetical protein
MAAPGLESAGDSEEQFQPLWLNWQEALNDVTFEAEREWIRRARSAWENRAEGT